MEYIDRALLKLARKLGKAVLNDIDEGLGKGMEAFFNGVVYGHRQRKRMEQEYAKVLESGKEKVYRV